MADDSPWEGFFGSGGLRDGAEGPVAPTGALMLEKNTSEMSSWMHLC